MSTQSCDTCPNFRDEKSSLKEWGHDFGAPTCALHGNMLGMPGEPSVERQSTLEAFGGSCNDYGVEGSTIQSPIFKVWDVDRETITEPVVRHASSEKPEISRCGECANYITVAAVRNKFGWSAGGCAAYGALLTGNQVATLAKYCPFSMPKDWVVEQSVEITVRTGVTDDAAIFGGLILDPSYSGMPGDNPATSSPSKTFKPRTKRAKVSLDPTNGPFVRESTDDEKLFGILGWNSVGKEGAKKDLFYPVFHPEFFDEIERELIPTVENGKGIHLYQDFDDVVFRMLTNMLKGKTPCLIGHAGTGKTEGMHYLAYLMQVPFHRISVSKSTEVASLTGYNNLEADNGASFMEWAYGRLATYLPRVGVICVDEPNMGPNEVWEMFRPLTDDASKLVLDDKKDKETIRKGLHCFFGMAMNPPWDPLYVGAQEISVADQSRMNFVSVGHPPRAVEKKIIRERCKFGDPTRGIDGFDIDEDELKVLLYISDDIRRACDRNAGGELEYSWGVRNNLSVAVLLDVLDMRDAFRMAALDGLDPEASAVIQSFIEGRMP